MCVWFSKGIKTGRKRKRPLLFPITLLGFPINWGKHFSRENCPIDYFTVAISLRFLGCTKLSRSSILAPDLFQLLIKPNIQKVPACSHVICFHPILTLSLSLSWLCFPFKMCCKGFFLFNKVERGYVNVLSHFRNESGKYQMQVDNY